MSWYNKVTWSEGLFLRPQLFQQQERYIEHFAHKRAAPLSPFFFGFSHYAIDNEALALGKVIVKSASGVFADGTPFDTPGTTPPPAPLTVRPEHLDQVIHLAVPIRVPNTEETTFDESSHSLARYAVFDTDLRDTNSIGQGPKTVQLSNLRLRLVPQKEMTDAWIGLPVTRVKTLRADGSIELDDTLIPPVSGYGASALLMSWLAKVHDLTRLRADALARRLTGSDGQAGKVKDMAEAIQSLTEARETHESLTDIAQQNQAQDAGADQSEVTAAMKAQNAALRGQPGGGDSGFPEFSEPHLTLASPAGIQTTSQGSTHIASADHIALTSGGHLGIAAGTSLFATVRSKIRLFVQKAGMRMVAAGGDIDIRALKDSINLLAKLNITHTANRITITAKEEVLINGGGSYTRWNAVGVETGTSGTWVVHSAGPSMDGPKNLPVEMPMLPKDVCVECLLKRALNRSALVNKGI